MTFYNWLIKFRTVDLAIGDLAQDVYNDAKFPKGSNDYNKLLNYLISTADNDDCVDTFVKAFKFYEISIKGA